MKVIEEYLTNRLEAINKEIRQNRARINVIKDTNVTLEQMKAVVNEQLKILSENDKANSDLTPMGE